MSADFPVYDHLYRFKLGAPGVTGIYAFAKGVAGGIVPKNPTPLLRLAIVLSADSVARVKITDGVDIVEAVLYEGSELLAGMFYGQLDIPARRSAQKGVDVPPAEAASASLTFDIFLDNPAAQVEFVNIMEVMRHVS